MPEYLAPGVYVEESDFRTRSIEGGNTTTSAFVGPTREVVAAFLYNEWRSGKLAGATPEEAFFVRCDRSSMTQDDIDRGRLTCLVGVATMKPAEFVIFRVTRKTVEAGN